MSEFLDPKEVLTAAFPATDPAKVHSDASRRFLDQANQAYMTYLCEFMAENGLAFVKVQSTV